MRTLLPTETMNSISKSKPEKIPQISIGMPVYNGERFISKRLDSIHSQTFRDFELIISDNASTDATPALCQEYAKKDARIRYYRQTKNMGAVWNFNFVLAQAKYEYFAWAAADDLWHPDFLKKNLDVLIKNANFVGCMSLSTTLDTRDVKTVTNYSALRKLLREKIFSMRPDLFPITGSYDKKVRALLKTRPYNMFYGVMRTSALKKSIVSERFKGSDFSHILNIIKFGDLYEVKEPLLYRNQHGEAWSGIFGLSRASGHNFWGLIFPEYPFTLWCAKNLGVQIFLKNLDQMILVNLEGEIAVVLELFLLVKNLLARLFNK